jgi:hypothetical protein
VNGLAIHRLGLAHGVEVGGKGLRIGVIGDALAAGRNDVRAPQRATGLDTSTSPIRRAVVSVRSPGRAPSAVVESGDRGGSLIYPYVS